MKTIVFLCILAVAGICVQAEAVTMTFDDIPAGNHLGQYFVQYNADYDGSFHVADHSTSTWGPPHSGNNVLVNQSPRPLTSGAVVRFGYEDGPFGNFIFTPISLFGGYFSTEQGVVIRLSGESRYSGEVASVVIGDPNGKWTNVYGELNSAIPMVGVAFYNVSSDDALFHYCADDITVEFVPEPSALTLLSFGLVGVGIGVARRRG